MENNTLERSSSSFISAKQIAEISNKILAMAKRHGATDAEVAVNFDKGFSVSTRLGEVETVEFNQDKRFAVTVYFGNRRGSATSSDLMDASLEQLIKQACDIAKVSDADPCYGLAEQSLLATKLPDLQLSHPSNMTPQQAVEQAKECETIALNLDKRIVNSEGCSISSYDFLRAYANSQGFNHSFMSSRHSKSCVLLAEDKEGLKREYDYTSARKIDNLVDNAVLAQSAVDRTLARLNGQKLSTRKCPVVFSSEISNTLLSAFLSAISGGAVYRKATFLLDKVGQAIFPERYHVQEYPYLIGGLASAAYDLEGVQTRENQFIKQGILQHYMLDSYTARKLGLQTTANAGGVHNLAINDDGLDLATLLKQMGTGLLVTSLMGSAVSLVTGDYSRGASGFWIENGEIAYPVEEVTIAGNLRDMLMNIALIANDIDVRKSTKCGSVLIAEMTVAGK